MHRSHRRSKEKDIQSNLARCPRQSAANENESSRAILPLRSRLHPASTRQPSFHPRIQLHLLPIRINIFPIIPRVILLKKVRLESIYLPTLLLRRSPAARVAPQHSPSHCRAQLILLTLRGEILQKISHELSPQPRSGETFNTKRIDHWRPF